MARSFLGTIYNALFARVLQRGQFVSGASLGSVVFQAGLVLGRALGGVLVSWAGKSAAYLTEAGFGLLAAIAVGSLRVTEPPLVLQRAPIFSSIGDGLTFVFGNTGWKAPRLRRLDLRELEWPARKKSPAMRGFCCNGLKQA